MAIYEAFVSSPPCAGIGSFFAAFGGFLHVLSINRTSLKLIAMHTASALLLLLLLSFTLANFPQEPVFSTDGPEPDGRGASVGVNVLAYDFNGDNLRDLFVAATTAANGGVVYVYRATDAASFTLAATFNETGVNETQFCRFGEGMAIVEDYDVRVCV